MEDKTTDKSRTIQKQNKDQDQDQDRQEKDKTRPRFIPDVFQGCLSCAHYTFNEQFVTLTRQDRTRQHKTRFAL